ncbi:MAG: hypothetical protein GOMPHAMPRED_002276 [Gomphillus americanus]|uniref:DUF7924 domain-containing protein n=1 Tax=Gomphillus americanus TaxID=1940652 RepID=A0A8H3FEL3_9LECA|nr:MAG: hypothetical protein GOMPHAMPRED_002276 [Gomphillus americanus]
MVQTRSGIKAGAGPGNPSSEKQSHQPRRRSSRLAKDSKLLVNGTSRRLQLIDCAPPKGKRQRTRDSLSQAVLRDHNNTNINTPLPAVPDKPEIAKRSSRKRKLNTFQEDLCVLDNKTSEKEVREEPEKEVNGTSGKEVELSEPKNESRIEHWLRTGTWPERLFTSNKTMSKRARTNTTGSTPATGPVPGQDLKQKSSYSSLVKNKEAPYQYSRAWADNVHKYGIILKPTTIKYHQDDEELIKNLFKAPETDPGLPVYAGEHLLEILDRVQNRNEARIVRDIQPLFMPSAENLAITTSIESLSTLVEEVNQSWVWAEAIRGPPPQSDLMVGFGADSFTELELEKMRNISTSYQPTKVTDSLYYPFAICEAKCPEKLEEASRQNSHAAAVVMRSLVGLYRISDMDVSELHERICVISVSHNHAQAQVYAHFPRIKDDKATWHQVLIAHPDLRSQDPKERWLSYNIFHNVYTIFAPKALKRITDALAKQRVPDPVVESTPELTDAGMGPPPRPDPATQQIKEMQKQHELEKQQIQDKLASMETMFREMMERMNAK